MEPKKSIFKIALGIILGVLALAGACTVTGCGSGGSGGGETVATTTPSPTPTPQPTPIPNITPTDTNGDGLPLKTRQYIEATYPDSARKRAALFQYAKLAEAAITDSRDEAKSVQHGQEYMSTDDCLEYTFGSVDAGRTARLSLDTVILNTDERNEAFLRYNGYQGTHVFHAAPYDQRAAGCTINPATLPN